MNCGHAWRSMYSPKPRMGTGCVLQVGELDPAFIDNQICWCDTANWQAFVVAQGRFRLVVPGQTLSALGPELLGQSSTLVH